MKLFNFIFLFVIIQTSCLAQNTFDIEKKLIGNWKCIKLDIRGNQKYTLKQANEIKNSILVIKKNSFCYSKIKFIDVCKFNSWKCSVYDTVELTGNLLDFTYTKKELVKIKVLDPVDINNEHSCYNNCSEFFLKEDTLINFCGGYTYFLIKKFEKRNTND